MKLMKHTKYILYGRAVSNIYVPFIIKMSNIYLIKSHRFTGKGGSVSELDLWEVQGEN